MKLSLYKILKEIYPQVGGKGEEILHKDLMPLLKKSKVLSALGSLIDYLEREGSVPEYMIPRLIGDKQTSDWIQPLVAQAKAQAKHRRLHPASIKPFDPYEKFREPKKKEKRFLITSLGDMHQVAEDQKNKDLENFLFRFIEDVDEWAEAAAQGRSDATKNATLKNLINSIKYEFERMGADEETMEDIRGVISDFVKKEVEEYRKDPF